VVNCAPSGDSGPIEHRMIQLRWQSCIIDGEAVACDDNGMPSFSRIRYRRTTAIRCACVSTRSTM
jgi:ATP-dependent DNA ligase